MQGILAEIVENKRKEIAVRKQIRPLDDLIQALPLSPPVRDFHTALKRGNGAIRLLAEIKAASPSSGVIRESFDPAEIAVLYEQCGAAAVSVLTDEMYFAGRDEHLQAAKAAISLPVLRKDFTLDEYQLYESRVLGADAVLLMAQVLNELTFAELLRLAQSLGLQVLAEGHTREQIEMIVSLGADTIGINNRDFDTMTTDMETTIRLRHSVPQDRVLVSQSGISTREEIARLASIGVDAVQIGTSIMKHPNMQEYMGYLHG